LSPGRGTSGRLAENVMHFARVLRAAGLPVGPGKVIAAIEAVAFVGVERREDFRACLAAVFLDRREQQALFDQAFHIFWRDPKLLERVLHMMLPRVEGRMGARAEDDAVNPRIARALLPAPRGADRPLGQDDATVELDATLTFSERERLQSKDFETMTAEEIEEAKRMLARLRLPLPAVPTRRFAPSAAGGSIDLRATLRGCARSGGEWLVPRRHTPRTRPSRLVAVCDISGSMARYSRMLLHFLHAIATDERRVHSFVFGTRLTHVTRSLAHRDVDQALAEVGRTAPDWSGGTRIGECLREFNVRWARRVLGQGAVVLLITDGLECGDGDQLAAEMARLSRSCRQVLWLNPLLRFDAFEPKATGIRAMLPHVDRFLPAHSIASLADVARALSGTPSAARALH